VSQGTKRETDDTHSHFSAGVNGCCATQTAKEMRIRTSDVRWHVISAAWPRPPHHHRDCLQVDDAVAIHIYVDLRSFYCPRYLAYFVLRSSRSDFRRAMEFRYFRHEVENHEHRTLLPSKQRGNRVPPYERTSICSEVCKPLNCKQKSSLATAS